MLPVVVILIALVMTGVGFGIDAAELLKFEDQPPPVEEKVQEGEWMGPDKFTVWPTSNPASTTEAVKGVSRQAPTPTLDPDPIVSCNVHANCGGGSRQMRQSECNQLSCCGFWESGRDWKLLSRETCKAEQEAEKRAVQAHADALLELFKSQESRRENERQQMIDSYKAGIQQTLDETDVYLNDMNKRISGYQGEFDVKVQKSLDDTKKAGTIVEPTPVVTPPKENNPGDPALWNMFP